MNEDLALELVEELRQQYEESRVFGGEINSEVVDNRNTDSFQVLGEWFPVQYDWVEGDSTPTIHDIQFSSKISKIRQAEHDFLISQLENADNVPTKSVSELTHNNLVEPLAEVYDPNLLYVSQSESFLNIENQREIQSIVNAFEGLERVGFDPEGFDESENVIYAVNGDYIRVKQCSRLPLDQTDWLPERTFSDLNSDIPEHPLYSIFGSSSKGPSGYVIAVASIPSRNPVVRDHGAVEIKVDS